MDMAKRSIIWKEPSRLIGFDNIRALSCDWEKRPTGLDRSPSHLLFGTCEALYGKTLQILDFIEDVFGFRQAEEWHWQKVFYSRLFLRFFPRSSNAPAWISVNPCRVPFESRFDVALETQTKEIVDPAHCGSPPSAVKDDVLDFHNGIPAIDARYLLLAHDESDVGDNDDPAYLLEQVRVRDIASGEFADSSTDWLFYAARWESDRERHSKGHVPAISAHYDEELRLLKTVSFTMAKVEQGAEYEVVQLLPTFHPVTGETAAIAPGIRSLKAYLLQYPLEHDLLLAAVES